MKNEIKEFWLYNNGINYIVHTVPVEAEDGRIIHVKEHSDEYKAHIKDEVKKAIFLGPLHDLHNRLDKVIEDLL